MPSTPKEETQVGIYHIINRGNMHMQVFDWVNYVNTPQSQKELDKIRNSVNRQAPIGCKNWVIKIRKTQT
ncbi:hypothetical protein [uncultured Gammaproteobacteria bacterium]|jgi:hypothetical protein|nr:hypothetical protein [uncultured Gammaproteobacteria bacterium]CAC9559685.1 hypothetical protein [uncultured Gammaproteobacteria bacterium]CAC9561699.1 hypothetical protein [uncultured Gammaproteobacteria bacterium]CAC9567819.1 hypothetical protein [uncultured Gammaproteobacteria bacterium]CAC9567835.1 hypothetical protein [uncultured Gammaproteobacteria bacterium]